MAELESFSPLDGSHLGSVPALAPEEVQAVVDDVARVQPFWAGLSLTDRARYMRRAAQAVIDELEDLARLLAREQGMALSEAHAMELLPSIDSLHWLAESGPRILGDERIGRPRILSRKRARFTFEPLGVVGVIAPWTHPWSIPFGKLAIALMAGNGVVLMPASLTPLIGERMRAVFERAGVPEGLVRTIHGGEGMGQALVESGAARTFFTDSVEVGRAIVCADARLPHAVAGCLWGAFANAGQGRSGIEQVYVLEEVAERFTAGAVEGAGRLRAGDPLDPRTEVGPMISPEQLGLVDELVDDAVAGGATLHCGGAQPPWFRPAVLTGVTQEMRIMRETVVGPVMTIVTVESEARAIELANGSEFGLCASVWTLDRAKGERIAARLDAGMVWINDHRFSDDSRSKLGLRECSNAKLLTWEPSRAPGLHRHPYDESLVRATRAWARLLYGRDSDKPEALRRGVLPLLRVGARTLRGALRR